MAKSTVEIVIKGSDQASTALNSVQGSLQGLSQHAGDAALTFGVLGAAGAALVTSITMTAARTEELGIVIKAMGKAAGIGEGELSAVEQSITSLGITTQSARTIMAQFMGAELDLAIATDIARAAQDLAVIGMKDSSQATADLTYALVSMNPRLLRQYGLYVNLNDVYGAAAETLGKEAAELTETEKRVAFLNATLVAAEGYGGVYEAAMETAGKQTRSLRRYVEELANTFGSPFLPALGSVTDMLTKFAKAMLALPAPVIEAMSGLLAMGTAVVAAQGSLAGVILLLPRIVGALQFMLSPLGLVTAAVAALAAAWIMDFGGIQEKTRTVFQAIRGFIETTLPAVRSVIETTLATIKTWWNDTHELIWTTVQTVWGAIQGFIQTTIATVQTIITTMTTVINQIWTEYNAEIKAVAIATWGAIQGFIATTLGTISSVIETTLATIKTWWNVDHALLKATTETIWAAIQLFIDTTLAGIWGTIEVIVRTIADWWDTNHEAIRATAETVWEAIRNLIEIATDAVKRIIETTLGTIIAWWDENHELIRATVETIWAAIQLFIETTLGFILNNIVMPILNAIKTFWDTHGAAILTIVETIWGAIEIFIDTTINVILGMIKTVMLLITGDWEGAWEEIKGIVETIWNGIKTIIGTSMEKVNEIIMSWLWGIVDSIQGMVGKFVEVGGDIIDGIKQGVKDKAMAMVDSVVNAIKNALAAAKRALGIGSPSKVFKEFGQAVMQGMAEGIEDDTAKTIGSLENAMSRVIEDVPLQWEEMWSGMVVATTSAVDAIIAAIGRIPRAFSPIGGKGGVSPGLAFGGAAPGITGGAFVPAGGAKRGGGSVNINIGNLYGTDKEAARKFGRQIAQEVAMRGALR